MTVLTVDLVDPTHVLTPSLAGGDGPLIDQLRDDCGFVIRGVDWVCRQLGFDLLAAIFDPIAGDYDAVDAMASTWAALGAGLGQVGGNYAALAGAVPSVWGGDAAAAAVTKLDDFAEGTAVQAEACALVSTAMQDMLLATKAVVALVADLLKMVDDAVMMLVASGLRMVKEIATGGGTIRRIIALVNRAITAIRTVDQVVPPLLRACSLVSAMIKTIGTMFQVGSVATASASGATAGDVASAAF